MRLLLVGVVAKAHGLRGEVVVLPHHVGSPLWKPGLALFPVPREVADRATDRVDASPANRFVLEAVRKQIAGGEERLLCTFTGIADRDAAEAVRGTHLAVDEGALPALAEDEFYHHELRGFAVVDLQGTTLGAVVGLLEGPAQDLIEVQPPSPVPARGPKPETWFVPFVSAIVKSVDRSSRTITLDPPEGLLP